MNERLKALREKWGKLATEGDAIRARYPGAEQMSAEDAEQYDRIMDDADEVWKDIEREEKALEATQRRTEPVTTLTLPGVPARAERPDAAAHRKAFKSFLRVGPNQLHPNDQATLMAYQADSPTEGGYLIAPEEFVAELLKQVDDLVYIRQRARKFTLTKAESLGVPTLETDMNDADWTSELATGTLDEAMRLGKRELFPHPLAKRIKLSRKLIRIAAIDPENLIRDRMAYKFAVTMEKAFLTGNGAQQPLGVFTASALGISTARDVNTGNATDVTADGIINAQYTLKPQYWAAASWLMHRLVLRNIRKLKDAEGQYLWVSGLQQNQAPTILGTGYTLSEFAPQTFSNGNYAAILADWNFYWIAEALDFQVQVLTELYAESNQVGYIGRQEIDGMPVLEEAFVRLKFAA